MRLEGKKKKRGWKNKGRVGSGEGETKEFGYGKVRVGSLVAPHSRC